MKPAVPVVSLLLLLLLATTTQGIRLDEETLAAASHNNIHEIKGSSMGGLVLKKVGVAPSGINGHSSGRSRKLMNKRMVTLKNERSEVETVSHRHSKEDVGRSGESHDLHHVEPSVSKQPQSYPDMLEIAGMDYSPAKRVPPIHN